MTTADTAAQIKILNRQLKLAAQTLLMAKGPIRVPAALERVQWIEDELRSLGAQPSGPRGTRTTWAIPA